MYRKDRLLPVFFLLLGGCASLPDSVLDLDPQAQSIELKEVPFFSQERYQCGPAALTTVLTHSGVPVALADMVDRVYVPGREGSFAVELQAATRTAGRVAYPVDGSLSALHAELATGRPVLVLQNLGVAAVPRWHYAVVVGIDPAARSVVLRSGTDERRITPMKTFLRTWRRSDYWGMVVLRPDEMPATVDRLRYFDAIAALEAAARPDAAASAWTRALEAWPGDTTALFGLANARYAQGDFSAAETIYRALLRSNAAMVTARNNLAMTLAAQARYDEALEQVTLGLKHTEDDALQRELERTRASVLGMQAEDR